MLRWMGQNTIVNNCSSHSLQSSPRKMSHWPKNPGAWSLLRYSKSGELTFQSPPIGASITPNCFFWPCGGVKIKDFLMGPTDF